MINKEAYFKLSEEVKKYNARIIAVSKRQEKEKIQELIDTGHQDFGENQAQSLSDRVEVFGGEVNWHFIGHLQTNKAKYIVPVAKLIHSVDSLKVFKAINKEAVKNNIEVDCLLQMHIAEEDTKFGFDNQEIIELLDSEAFANSRNINITGLMGMATYTDNESQVGKEFSNLRKTFEMLRKDYFLKNPSFKELSMGMSGDYKIALEEGSTMIRVGTLIFGARNY
jgi:pyridoxal phosphate enzyme (YggS family)